jgi:beta-aspartyl-peptidase (threonine type)
MKNVKRSLGLLLLVSALLSVAIGSAAVQASTFTTIGEAAPSTRTKTALSPEAAIRAELEAQVAAWNRGDLKGYMNGYWHSPELTFFAGSNQSEGWDAAYQRYHAAYAGKSKEMGKLKFTNIRVEVLGPEAGFVRGGWQLTMKDGSQRTGLFTVVLKKFGGNWRIIHDHSS